MKSRADSRKSVWFHSEAGAIHDATLARLLSYYDKSLSYRFIQDVVNGVIPAGIGRHGSALSIKVEPSDRAVSDMVAVALGTGHRLEYGLYEFLSSCVSSTLVFGNTAYEIVFESDVNINGMRQFHLVHIPPRSLDFSGDKMPIQRVPSKIAEELGVPEAIQIPRSHLVIFEAPSSHSEDLRLLMERLAVLSDPLIPDFALVGMSQPSTTTPFDLSKYTRTRKLAMVEASKSIGWTGGEIYGPVDYEVAEHYWWYRELIFLRFNTKFRDSVMAALNDGLMRAGKVAGFRPQVKLIGFPTMNEVDLALEHLQIGDRPLSEFQGLLRRASGLDA